MELGDIGGLLVFAIILMLPLWSIYFVLKRMGWANRGRLFLDAWQIWLAWLVSSIAVFVLVAYVNFQTGFPKGFVFVVYPAMFAGNLLAVAAIVRLLLRADKVNVSIRHEDSAPPFSGPIWKAAIYTNVAATITVVAVIGFGTLVGIIRDAIYPRPKTNFQIYD